MHPCHVHPVRPEQEDGEVTDSHPGLQLDWVTHTQPRLEQVVSSLKLLQSPEEEEEPSFSGGEVQNAVSFVHAQALLDTHIAAVSCT